jgi:NADH:ubiquinone oxidoreductase subunit 4 (subunit M)
VNQTIADLTGREIAVMVPLIALMLLLGIYPQPLLSRMEPSVALMLNRIHSAEARDRDLPRIGPATPRLLADNRRPK